MIFSEVSNIIYNTALSPAIHLLNFSEPNAWKCQLFALTLRWNNKPKAIRAFMEPVTRFIEQNFGLSFLVGVIVVGAVISGIVWITIWAVKLTNKHKDISKRIDDLPCPHHTSKIDKHDEQFADTRALMSRMEGQLELLVQNSIEKGNRKIKKKSGLAFSAKHSPRQLNGNGIELLNDCGGKEFLETNMDFFIGKMEKLQPKTALDVEDMALAVLQTHTNEDMFIPLKSWVYNAPSREIKNPNGSTRIQDVDLDDVIFVLSLPLRDKYLELHPEIIK